MENKKGSTVLVIILLIVLVGAGAYIFYQYKSYGDLDKKYTDVNNKYNELNKKSTEKVVEDNSLKEGYVVFKSYRNQENIFNIYGLSAYSYEIDGLVVAYNNSLYYVSGLKVDDTLANLPTTTLNEEGYYSQNGNHIKKFNGKESDLAKVVFSKATFSTDGSKYPILIYKDGSVESINEVSEALKNYKIKNFISEKCIQPGDFMCAKAEYEVVLQDGTTQKVQY